MTKELVTIEFRYNDAPKNSDSYECVTKKITIGVFDKLEDAIEAGNNALDNMSDQFDIRGDRFKKVWLFGSPRRLVCEYKNTGVAFFAKIDKLEFADLKETISEAYSAAKRYRAWKLKEED